MAGSKSIIFLIMAAQICDLSIHNYAMSSSKSAMKRTDECDVCGKMSHTVKAYNQHQRSFYLRWTGCFALSEQTRVNVVAAARPNMSTAAVERRPAKRTRGTENMNYLCIFSIFYIFCIRKKISKWAYPRGVGPFWDAYFKLFFIFWR